MHRDNCENETQTLFVPYLLEGIVWYDANRKQIRLPWRVGAGKAGEKTVRQPPENFIAKEAVKVWRITALIPTVILWIVLIVLTFFAGKFSIPIWVVLVAWAVMAVDTYITVYLIPAIKWRRWRYQVFEQEIDIQHGILIIKRTLVPMIRVQHVDTKQGPLLKRFKLATVTISTAATTHEIPALLEEEASALRDKISRLARVDEDDV